MRVAICDDEADELKRILFLIEDYQRTHPACQLQVSPFHSGAELLLAAERQSLFDLYLLDVLMPGMTGIELANRLHLLQRRPRIVFLTTSREYAIDAFRVRARQYLLKPLQREPFFSTLDEVLPVPVEAAEAAFTILAAQNIDLTLPISSILYAECVAHTVHYHLTDGSTVDSRTLRLPFSKTVAPLLATGKFLLIHRSFAVNLEQVQRVTENTVRLKDGTELAVARLRQREIRSAYIDYLSRSERAEVP